ncbi:hypothetical protein Fleli_2190 [Bernardetia litoralis DSM 6794]|uniref:Uncharacterized protein n=1 Tax=Bernardetia litoralis (strain ATCC 23117 / DSM 6794 / NBRC 15988 / NCIMB 1366 / Fx l1 / Sio-4) TaxID=880071 RepID=I4AKT4_BERLS|nr:hypothetical protein [Bernardetia litoralis]AFM04569.1 hypothetical protein Fleli_2190 [Bernardetia litoralis DSM 6794]
MDFLGEEELGIISRFNCILSPLGYDRAVNSGGGFIMVRNTKISNQKIMMGFIQQEEKIYLRVNKYYSDKNQPSTHYKLLLSDITDDKIKEIGKWN